MASGPGSSASGQGQGQGQGTGPSSGRSPFPPSRHAHGSRTRASGVGAGVGATRLSLGDESVATNATQTSPMYQNGLFASGGGGINTAGGGWSPHRSSASNSTTNQYKTRFFPGTNTGTATKTAATGTGTPDEKDAGEMDTTSANSHTNSTTLDGIPVDHLRSLATKALLQSPSQAAFYASILYAKTGTPHDALLLAQADLSNHKYTACLRILEESGLLLSDYPWEALLLACAALAATGEWSTLLDLLEDACRLPDPSNTTAGTSTSTAAAGGGFRALSHQHIQQQQPLDDNDDFAWETLKQSIQVSPDGAFIHPLARLCCWRGQAYQENGHGLRAAVYWKQALKMDAQCQQAWEALLDRNLLTPPEAYALIQELEFNGMDWLKSLYLARIELTPQDPSPPADAPADAPGAAAGAAADETGQFQQEQQEQDMAATPSFAMRGGLDASSIQMSSPISTFQTPPGGGVEPLHTTTTNNNNNKATGKSFSPILDHVDAAFNKLWNEYKLDHCPQVLAMAARRSYRRCDWKASLAYCQELAQLDPAMTDAAFCYVATLVILGHKRVLFRLAHEWVDASPKSAQAWFAVGAYYFCCERYHVAQRHFCRATRLDPQCTEAWIAFGCSFAACDESDQALASFRAAQRLSPGEHSSLLYMGMEYVRTNHLVLAQYFLESALSTSGGDPLCSHELGVLASLKGDHGASIPFFQRALAATVGGDSIEETIDMSHDPYWEPTLFNLGHSFRKTRQFPKAQKCFERCVSLCPDKFSTYAALAFTKHLMSDLDGAIEYYHQALSCKPDDPFSTEMLNRALREALSTTLRVSEAPPSTAQKTPKPHARSFLSPSSEWSRREDSIVSDEMESDVDMSGAS
jgi:tetratricopeptide (TPR) repeat protein